MPKSVQEILDSPAINYGSEHRAWVIAATDDQLDEYILRISGNQILHTIAVSERERRHFKYLSEAAKPHWTLIPSYRVLRATLIMTIMVFVATVLAWLFPRVVEKETTPHYSNARSNAATSIYIPTPVLAPTNLPQTKAAAQQTSPAAIYTLPGTNMLKK
ncbi:MAG TPA: hypothetical protein VIK28_04185 [Sedimentisphaerales bacterium]